VSGFRLILKILNFTNVALLFLVTIDAVIYTGKRSWRIIEQILKLDEGLLVNCLSSRLKRLGVVVEVKVLPAVGIETRKIES
jgi:hypothetical protein